MRPIFISNSFTERMCNLWYIVCDYLTNKGRKRATSTVVLERKSKEEIIEAFADMKLEKLEEMQYCDSYSVVVRQNTITVYYIYCNGMVNPQLRINKYRISKKGK